MRSDYKKSVRNSKKKMKWHFQKETRMMRKSIKQNK